MTRAEAHHLLYTGRANVAKTAKEVGVSTEELKQSFARYAAVIPMDDTVWQGDIELGWPWA